MDLRGTQFRVQLQYCIYILSLFVPQGKRADRNTGTGNDRTSPLYSRLAHDVCVFDLKLAHTLLLYSRRAQSSEMMRAVSSHE